MPENMIFRTRATGEFTAFENYKSDPVVRTCTFILPIDTPLYDFARIGIKNEYYNCMYLRLLIIYYY